MPLIINVYFASHGKGDLEEEKAGRGGMVVGGDTLWVLTKKTSTHQPTLLKIAFRWQEFKFIFYLFQIKLAKNNNNNNNNTPTSHSHPKKTL